MKKPWIFKMILIIPLIIAAVTFATMSLWNWLVPVLFNGPAISFWQTLGLLIFVPDRSLPGMAKLSLKLKERIVIVKEEHKLYPNC